MMKSLFPAHCTCVSIGDQQLKVVKDLWQVSIATNSQVGSYGTTKQNHLTNRQKKRLLGIGGERESQSWGCGPQLL